MQLSRIEPSPLSSIDIMFSIEQELLPIQAIVRDCFSRIETKESAMSYFQGINQYNRAQKQLATGRASGL